MVKAFKAIQLQLEFLFDKNLHLHHDSIKQYQIKTKSPALLI